MADLFSKWDHTNDRERKLKKNASEKCLDSIHLDHTPLNHNI